jgi:hypothetical protein
MHQSGVYIFYAVRFFTDTFNQVDLDMSPSQHGRDRASYPYATFVKRGLKIPHPRHWMKLAELSGNKR